jgi:hypothetical protein
MGHEAFEYKNLTEFLLRVVRQRPAMYLSEAKISLLPTFIFGYMTAFGLGKNVGASMDEYFGENGFLEWMDQKYNIGQLNSWTTLFPDKTNNDEKKSLELYFNYLQEYYDEKKS